MAKIESRASRTPSGINEVNAFYKSLQCELCGRRVEAGKLMLLSDKAIVQKGQDDRLHL